MYGNASELTGKLFHLNFDTDFVREEVVDKERRVAFRSQSLAVANGHFSRQNSDSDIVGEKFRFSEPSFHLVNMPSDKLRMNVTSLRDTGLALKELNFSIRLVLFKVAG